MKLFVCHRSSDQLESEKVINFLFELTNNSIAVLRETDHDEKWKEKVEEKFKEVDFVMFLIGSDTFESDQLKWEYAKAKELNKRIVGIKLNNATEESILFCQALQRLAHQPKSV